MEVLVCVCVEADTVILVPLQLHFFLWPCFLFPAALFKLKYKLFSVSRCFLVHLKHVCAGERLVMRHFNILKLKCGFRPQKLASTCDRWPLSWRWRCLIQCLKELIYNLLIDLRSVSACKWFRKVCFVEDFYLHFSTFSGKTMHWKLSHWFSLSTCI